MFFRKTVKVCPVRSRRKSDAGFNPVQLLFDQIRTKRSNFEPLELFNKIQGRQLVLVRRNKEKTE